MSGERLSPRDLARTAELIRALDSELRLSILLLLDSGERVVHEMVDELGKSQPLISQHLRVLKSAGLVDSRRAGREGIYSLAEPAVIDIILRLASLSATGDVDRRRIAGLISRRGMRFASGSGSAAIVDPPAAVRPAQDPGLVPRTPKPRRD